MQSNGTGAKPLGLYFHIPFCRSKCEYCDFYSLPTGRKSDLMDRYVGAVIRNMRETVAHVKGYRVDTIYFGGGTPSFFGPARLQLILNDVFRRFDVTRQCEITAEANPDSLDLHCARRLARAGFNRISIGIQSDSNEMLKALGRPHNYMQAQTAVRNARRAGFRNVSVDLMFGLPNQTREQWVNTLQNVLQLKPDHVSCYGLKVEPGTPLWEYRDCANLPDDDLQADMYLGAVHILDSFGFAQYEISNFAQPGMESRHNLKYWQGGEYLGFGPSAASDFSGKRFTCAPDIESYIQQVENGGIILSECEEISLRERASEYLMLRLRTVEGINAEEYCRSYQMAFPKLESELRIYERAGYAAHQGKQWYLTPKGFLLSNQIIGSLLESQQAIGPVSAKQAARNGQSFGKSGENPDFPEK